MNNSIIYALDFDGVICDSAVETAISGWKAAASIWSDMPKAVPHAMIDRFRVIRPIIETGYESVLAMRLLYLNESVEDISSDYANKIKILLAESQLTIADLKALFGETRDGWITNDLADWINMNPLYEGVAGKLQKLGKRQRWYVVTTKHERFVKQILEANEVELADEQIFGLDRNMSKIEVLTGLLKSHPNETIVFVEDRLPMLLSVSKNAGLASVKLAFASWGYSTAEDKQMAAGQQAIISQQLEGFLEL